MTQEPFIQSNKTPLDENVSFETILDAWQSATDRLQETHQELRSEVRRLSDELESKNIQLARQNRLADLGQMAAHVAHEIRNGLMPITLYLSQLERRLSNHVLHVETVKDLKLIDKIKSGMNDVQSTITDLLHFAGDRPADRQSSCLVELVHAVCNSLLEQFNAHSIELRIDAPDHLVAEFDSQMMRRCLLNLLLNAIEVMNNGGVMRISISSTESQFHLILADTGGGVDKASGQKLFEPFYTTKSQGTGLGLAIVEKIVQNHEGSIEVHNDDQGAVFSIEIPRFAQSNLQQHQTRANTKAA